MKVGTDGVLLGAWVNVEGAGSILDVGTGTGLLAIMMAQRSSGAFIDAVEIDENACGQARENVSACPWKDRIMVHHDSFQHFARQTGSRYHVIVSNPPWYRNSLKPPSLSRSMARHDERLGYEELLDGSDNLLSGEGRLGIILPAREITRLTELAYLHDLHLLRKTLVRPAPDKDHSRCLAEFGRLHPFSVEERELVIKQGNKYSDEYIELTKEYYLSIC
jgi:tRNA1Val (adenine37-N6)-methyltransferase